MATDADKEGKEEHVGSNPMSSVWLCNKHLTRTCLMCTYRELGMCVLIRCHKYKMFSSNSVEHLECGFRPLYGVQLYLRPAHTTHT